MAQRRSSQLAELRSKNAAAPSRDSGMSMKMKDNDGHAAERPEGEWRCRRADERAGC
jgi:hypothetical protein